MTRFVYDQFAKDYLEYLLRPLGEVQAPRRVAAEVQQIDVWFAPASQPTGNAEALGLPGQFAATPAMIEPFRNAVTRNEVCDCLLKLLLVRGEFRLEARRDETNTQEDLPRLWILTPTASVTLLSGFRAILDERWIGGVYFLADSLRTAVVVIHQLPRTPETMWLRLLGRGAVQEQAVEEVKALPETDPRRFGVLEWLKRLEANLEVSQGLNQDDRRLIMRLLPLYEEKLAADVQAGIQEALPAAVKEALPAAVQEVLQEAQLAVQRGQRLVVENMLKAQFGALTEDLAAIIPSILALPVEEYASLLLQLSNSSREELLARFVTSSEASETGEISETGETDF